MQYSSTAAQTASFNRTALGLGAPNKVATERTWQKESQSSVTFIV